MRTRKLHTETAILIVMLAVAGLLDADAEGNMECNRQAVSSLRRQNAGYHHIIAATPLHPP